jgi:hypothetical protein
MRLHKHAEATTQYPYGHRNAEGTSTDDTGSYDASAHHEGGSAPGGAAAWPDCLCARAQAGTGRSRVFGEQLR